MVELDPETQLFMDYMNGKISVEAYREKSIQYQEEQEQKLREEGLLSEV